MIKQIKKFLLVLLLIFLPFLSACDDSTQETIYYLNAVSEEIDLYVGDEVQIEIDTNITDTLEWTSSDEDCVTVDENGVAKGIKSGEAVLYTSYFHLELEVKVIVSNKPLPTYTITIDGYDTIETTRTGVAIQYFLQQKYGNKMHPTFNNYIFDGYYTDKECTKELDLMTKLYSSITIYPKLKLDNTNCELMVELDNVLLFEDEVKVTEGIQVFSPDFGSTVAFKNETYENCNLYEVRYDYATSKHSITNVYTSGKKENTKIPFDGFIIMLPKTNALFDVLNEKFSKGTEIAFDRYSINVANRLDINKVVEKENVSTINPYVNCTYSSVYDFTNDTYIFQKNADNKAYPASTNKIITAITAVQNAPLDLKITVGDELDYMYQGSSPGTAGSKKGQVWTLRQLLYAMLLPSGNDSAYTIAAGVARSLPGNENKSTLELLKIFANLMNGVRDQVGANNSHFMHAPDGNSYYLPGGDSSTPNLYDERLYNQYVTANDMIKFAKLAFNYPAIANVTSTVTKSFKIVSGESFTFNNTNQLIKSSSSNYYKYAVGLKTGTTTPAGQCLIFGAEKDGRFVIAAVMKATNRYSDSLAILRATFGY